MELGEELVANEKGKSYDKQHEDNNHISAKNNNTQLQQTKCNSRAKRAKTTIQKQPTTNDPWAHLVDKSFCFLCHLISPCCGPTENKTLIDLYISNNQHNNNNKVNG